MHPAVYAERYITAVIYIFLLSHSARSARIKVTIISFTSAIYPSHSVRSARIEVNLDKMREKVWEFALREECAD